MMSWVLSFIECFGHPVLQDEIVELSVTFLFDFDPKTKRQLKSDKGVSAVQVFCSW